MKLNRTFAIISLLAFAQAAIAQNGAKPSQALLAFGANPVPQMSRWLPSGQKSGAKPMPAKAIKAPLSSTVSAQKGNHLNQRKDDRRFILGGPDVVPM